MDRPSLADEARVSEALTAEPTAWRPVRRKGQVDDARWVVTLPTGERRFVKLASNDDTASWLRDEYRFYSLAGPRPYLPRFLGWHDDGERPVLVLEDLSGAEWPPPWNVTCVRAVGRTLRDVAESEIPPDLAEARNSQFALDAWPHIAADPEPFLTLGLCSADWLGRHLARLSEAASSARFEGDSLLHFDVRSDNICFRDGRALLIDWNFACLGNPIFDGAAWLPSLHAEGGPLPERVLPTTDEVAAIASLLAGNFAWRGARPNIPEAPHVRPLQRTQATTALPWAARTLGIPPP